MSDDLKSDLVPVIVCGLAYLNAFFIVLTPRLAFYHFVFMGLCLASMAFIIARWARFDM